MKEHTIMRKHLKDKNIDITLTQESNGEYVVVIEDNDKMLDRWRSYKTLNSAIASINKFIKEDRHLVYLGEDY